MIRAFVGITVPPEITRVLEAAQAGLPVGRPVPPENFHVTVLYLGEHPEPVIEDMHHALDAIRAPSFALHLDCMSSFGKPVPRVLHAALRPEPALKALRDKVARAAHTCQIPIERKGFVPHITLSRHIGKLLPDQLIELQTYIERRIKLPADPFPVEEFVLFRSHLGRTGPHYEPLAEYPLTSGPMVSPLPSGLPAGPKSDAMPRGRPHRG